MKIRREINLLNSLLTCASGAEVTSTNYTPIVPVGTGSNATYYFEIIARSSSSISFVVGLRRVGIFSNESSITVPTSTTTYTRFRSASFTSFVTSPYNAQVHIDNTSGATKDVIAARIVCIQEDPTVTMEMFDIGTEDLAKINTTSAALAASKCWLYTAANYDGTLTFEVGVRWLTATTKNTCTITLQEDNGSFGSWTNLVTIVSAASSTAITSTTVSFTPTDGRNYRIASLGSTTKSSYSIYSAKIRVLQQGAETSQDITFKNVYADATHHYKLSDENDAIGSSHLTNVDASFNAGKFGNAVDFGDTAMHDKYLNIDDDFGIDVNGTSDGWSMSYWFNRSSSAALVPYHFYIRNADNRILAISYLDSTGEMRTQSGASPEGPTYTFATSEDTWYHVVLTSDGTNMRLYVHGALRDTNTVAGINFGAGGSTTATFYIGNRPLLGRGWHGLIDDFVIFARALTASEVNAIYFTQLKKFECQMMLANKTFAAGTSLQDYDTLYDPDEWADSDVDFFHEINSVASGTSDIKLQDTSGPTDITGSTVTDAIERERTAAMTMPGSAATIDCIATSNNSNIYASRIIAVVIEPVTIRIPRPISIGHPFIF